jgi:YjbE family integral membrane protein
MPGALHVRWHDEMSKTYNLPGFRMVVGFLFCGEEQSLDWLLALGNVVFINTILSGDNSIVISLAANQLPESLRKRAIIWGGITAVGLRILLLIAGIYLISIPFCKIVAALLLFWIAVQLIQENMSSEPQTGFQHSHPNAREILGEVAVTSEGTSSGSVREPQARSLWKAIRTIAVADFVMSLDNAVAMLGAADGYVSVLCVGLIISVPLLTWGSHWLSRILQKNGWLVWIAVSLLGWTAGDMFADDHIFQAVPYQDVLNWCMRITGTISILGLGILWMKRTKQAI